MKKNVVILSKPISWVSLMLIVVPPVLYFTDIICVTAMTHCFPLLFCPV